MTRNEAIDLLGGEPRRAADLLGVTTQAVNKWPDELPPRIADRVLGACLRHRIVVPSRFIGESCNQISAETPATQAPAAIDSEVEEGA